MLNLKAMNESSNGINFMCSTYTDHLQSMLNSMYTSPDFTDVTLVCDEQKQLSGHKVILSCCSPVLKKIIQNNPHPYPLIYFRGVKYETMQSLLNFVYLGKASMSQDNVDEFLRIAKELEIKELCNNPKIDSVTKTTKDSNADEMDNNDTKEDKDQKKKIIPKEMQECSIATKVTYENDINEASLDHGVADTSKAEFGEKTVSEKNFQVHINKLVESEQNCINETYNGKRADKENENDQNNAVINGTYVDCKKQSNSNHHGTARSNTVADAVPDKSNGKDDSELKDLNRNQASDDRIENSSSDLTKNIVYEDYKSTVKHEGHKYKCNFCSFHTMSKGSLKKHIEAIHEGNKYTCNVCNKEFSFKHNLKTHVQSTHEGVRYECNYCGYKATQKQGLKIHIQRRHTKYV